MGNLNCRCSNTDQDECQFQFDEIKQNKIIEILRKKYEEKDFSIEIIKEEDFDKILDSLNIKSILSEYKNYIIENNNTLNEQIIDIPPLKITNNEDNMIECYKVNANNEGKFTGNGYHIFKNDFIYYGYFKNDEYNGKGLLITNKKDIFYGNWKDGECNGDGMLKIKDQLTYKGKFVNNKKNGYGIETYPNGAKYEGDFVDNQKCGKGKYYLGNGDIYEGNFENDLYNGDGVYIWGNDGREYRGKFKDGNMEGWGVNKFNDGSVYEGNYKTGQKHGKGCYSWSNGKKYKGNWVNNKLHGNGCYEINDEKYFVTFRFGKLISAKKVIDNEQENELTDRELIGNVKFNKNNIINISGNVDDLICNKCGFVIVDPQKCIKCGKNYCLNCIKENEGIKCIYCEESNFEANLELLHKLISKTKILCNKCNIELNYQSSLTHRH